MLFRWAATHMMILMEVITFAWGIDKFDFAAADITFCW